MAEMPGVQKRFSAKDHSNRVRFKGQNHSMHRKDGAEGSGSKDGKVKYQDIGEKYGGPQPIKGDDKHYPSLHVHGDKLDLSEHKPGDSVEMQVKGKLKEHRVTDDGKHHYHVEITHAAKKD